MRPRKEKCRKICDPHVKQNEWIKMRRPIKNIDRQIKYRHWCIWPCLHIVYNFWSDFWPIVYKLIPPESVQSTDVFHLTCMAFWSFDSNIWMQCIICYAISSIRIIVIVSDIEMHMEFLSDCGVQNVHGMCFHSDDHQPHIFQSNSHKYAPR